MREPLAVFGYGSLMYEPPHPEALLEQTDAVLHGHRRALCKRSITRGCRKDEAFLEDGLAEWSRGARRLGLCMGTIAEDGARLEGRLLVWSGEVAGDVVATLDSREGFVPGRPDASQGYLRTRVEVVTASGNVPALAYLSSPTSSSFAPGLDAETTGAILAHATPKERGEKARGIWYALRAMEVLAQAGVEDAGMAAAVEVATARLREAGWDGG